MNSVFSNIIFFLGRIFISLIFIIAGFTKIVDFQHTATMMAGMGIPTAEFLLVLAIIFELGGGLLLFFGYYTRFATVLLFVFVVFATFYFHTFWEYEGAAKIANMQHFFKNLCISGGLFYVFVHGAGQYALDELRK